MPPEKILQRLILLGIIAALLAGCGAPALQPTSQPMLQPTSQSASQPTSQPTQPPIESKIVVAYGVSPKTMDPQMNSNTVNESILRNIFECLTVRAADMKTIEPGLAESWKRIDDTTMQFKLRQGVKFHNGEPFNAAAVKFSLERALNPDQKAPLGSALATIKSVDVVDDYTVNIVTAKPDPILLARLAGYAAAMMPPGYVQEKGDEYIAANPVGTGPYQFVSWVKDGDLTLEANPDYWGGPAKIKTVIIEAIPEDATRMAALKTGEVDIAVNVPPTEIEPIQAGGKAEVKAVPSARIIHVILDAQKGPTADVKVRQALNYAVDVDSIIRNIYQGHAYRIATALTPLHSGYDPDLKPYPYDPGKAKQLLAEAGLPDGFEVVFDTPKGRYPMDKEVAEAIAGQLAKVGVKAKVVVDEWGVYNSKSDAHELGALSLWGWGTNTFDATDTLRMVFRTAKTYPDKTTSRQTYSNPKFDALVDEAIITLDEAKRMDDYKQAQRILYDDAANIWLFQLEDIYGVSKRIDWQPRSDEQIWLYLASLK